MLQTFRNEEFGEIRTVKLDGVPWFVGKDVAEALGYKNHSKAIADHVDEEDKLDSKPISMADDVGELNNKTLSSLGQRGGILINESGLYSLIMSSKLPSAKAFKRWVTSEVLPAIRETGAYMINTDDSDTPMHFMSIGECISVARLLAHCPRERLGLVTKVLSFGGLDFRNDVEVTGEQFVDTSDIGARLLETKDRYQMTYAELCRRTGLPRQTLCYYVHGQRFPRPDRYKHLINCLSRIATEEDSLHVVVDYTE